MGFYFRKSFKFGPVRLNLSKSGLGLSAGVKGLRYGVRPDGTARTCMLAGMACISGRKSVVVHSVERNKVLAPRTPRQISTMRFRPRQCPSCRNQAWQTC